MPVQPLIDDPQVRELAEKQIIAGAFADEAVTTRGGIKNLPQALQRPTLPALKIPQEYEAFCWFRAKPKQGVQELPHKKIRTRQSQKHHHLLQRKRRQNKKSRNCATDLFYRKPFTGNITTATIINKSLLQKIFQKQNHK